MKVMLIKNLTLCNSFLHNMITWDTYGIFMAPITWLVKCWMVEDLLLLKGLPKCKWCNMTDKSTK